MVLNMNSLFLLFLLVAPLIARHRTRRPARDFFEENEDDVCESDNGNEDDNEGGGDDDDVDEKPQRKQANNNYLVGNVLKDGYAEENEDQIPVQGGICPDGWQGFDRVRGKWCIKVFAKESNSLDAQAKCAAEGGRLTSVETKKEKDYINNKGIELLIPTGSKGQKYIWIGASRRQECNDINKATCLPYEVNTFYWSDEHATGKRQMDFGCYTQQTHPCAVFSVQNVDVGDFCLLPGMMKEEPCGYSPSHPGFACGKEATS